MENKSILSRLMFYAEKKKMFLFLSLFFSTLANIFSIIPFVLIWFLVKEIFDKGVNSNVIFYAWSTFGLIVLGIIFYFISLMLSHLTAFRIETNMRRFAMQRISNMPMGFFDVNTSGKIRKIIDEGSSATHTFVAHQMPDLIATMITPIISLILIFIFNWRLGLATLLPIVLAMTLMVLMSNRGQDMQKKYMDSLEKINTEAIEYVRGIPVVKVFSQTIYSFKNFYNSIIEYKKMIVAFTNSWENPMAFYITMVHSFAFFLIPISIFIIGRNQNYSLIIIDLFLFILVTPIFGTTIMKSMHLNYNISMAKESLDRIEKLVDFKEISNSKAPKNIGKYNIEFEDVVFSYPNSNKNAINHINFNIPQGKTYALVGPSGGGKSTTARLIPRFWDINEGSINIGGINIKDIASKELMQNITFVFQNTKLFKMTILENIKYGNENASLKDVERAIELSQSKEIIDNLPDGLNTKIGSQGTYLSGGEQQRIALARAILKDAPIVILDEATAFADPENEHLIQKAFKELMKGKTVLMIAHRLTTIKDVDKILVIDKGIIIEEGTHKELVEQKNKYFKMWNEYQKSTKWSI